jgi:hypothetical protein
MRAHFLGRPDLAAASRHSFPILKPGPDGQPRRKRAAAREGANTMVMSWFPSWKGEPRMMPLRHYHHVDMATLLEADASVLRWTSRLEDLPERQVAGIELPHVHFVAFGHRHRRAIRVLRPRVARGRIDEVQAAEGYAALGYRFEVHSADALKDDATVRVARALLYERVREVPREVIHEAVEWCMTSEAPVTLGAIHDALGTDRVSWEQVLAMAARGHLVIEVGETLGRDTPVLRGEPVALAPRPEVLI